MYWYNNMYSLIKDETKNIMFTFNKKTEEKDNINEDMFNILSYLSNESFLNEDTITFLKESDIFDLLIEKNIISEKEQNFSDNIFIQTGENNIDRIFLEISQRCNLKCKHCYNGSAANLSNILTDDNIYDLVINAKNSGCYVFQITGGEPLIRKNITKFIEFIGNNGFKITIFTNLTYLPRNIIPIIKKYHIKIVTSVDFFSSEKHDEFRGMNGALNLTLKNIKKLKDENIDVRVNMMLDGKNNSEIEELINYLKLNIQVPYIADVIIPTGRGKRGNKSIYLKEISKKYKHIAIDSVINSEQLNLNNQLECSLDCIYSNDCGVGKSFLFIDSFGNVTICPSMRIEDSIEFSFGNILEESFQNILSKFNKNEIDLTCQYKNQCDFYEQCKGGCRSRAYHFMGETSEVDPIMCYVYNNKILNINKEDFS